MSRLDGNGIRIEYDTMGSPQGRPLILVMGLGAQLIEWPRVFCEKLADRGHYVVRFDNRDAGLSSKIEEGGMPDILALMGGAGLDAENKQVAPYLLGDMAADTVSLMDGLGIDKAHVCGISMGGMIAQTVAVNSPDRVASLVSLQSTTGDPSLPPPTPEAAAALFTPPPQDRKDCIDHLVGTLRCIAGGSPAFDEADARASVTSAVDRCYYPQGVVRQLAAILASGDRTQQLAAVKAPTLVLHGDLDPLIPPEHGEATARAIPGATFYMVRNMGHALSFPALWDELVEQISRHTAHQV